FRSQQRFKNSAISIKSSGIENGIVGTQKVSQLSFQLFMDGLGPANKSHRRHAVAIVVDGIFGSLKHARMRRESQIIISTKVDDFLSALGIDDGSLRGGNHPLLFIQPFVL